MYVVLTSLFESVLHNSAEYYLKVYDKALGPVEKQSKVVWSRKPALRAFQVGCGLPPCGMGLGAAPAGVRARRPEAETRMLRWQLCSLDAADFGCQ